MATSRQLAAIAGALALYLEAEVLVELKEVESPWGLAGRHEAVGFAGAISGRDQLPG